MEPLPAPRTHSTNAMKAMNGHRQDACTKGSRAVRGRRAPTVLATGIIAAACFLASAFAEIRVWTSTDGRTLEGEIVALEDGTVTLKTERGNFEVPLERFIDADREFAREWNSQRTLPSGAPLPDNAPGDFEDLELGVWPNSISADFEVSAIETVEENASENRYIYRSPHFEFHSPVRLSASVVREFSRMFEATYEFTRVMPIGLGPKPSGDGYYFTQLYADMDAYYQAGGMPGSGGMHRALYRGTEVVNSEIHVPLTSLGVTYTGTRFIVDSRGDSSTLIHEIVHQMKGRWLPLTPIWYAEGIAETISVQNYNNGRFTITSMDRAIREDVTRRTDSSREFEMLNLEALMTMTSERWASDLATRAGGRINYPSANLLFYYYLRMDGEGDAAHLVEYMKALASGAPEPDARDEHLLRGRDWDELQNDVASAWRSSGLRLSFR